MNRLTKKFKYNNKSYCFILKNSHYITTIYFKPKISKVVFVQPIYVRRDPTDCPQKQFCWKVPVGNSEGFPLENFLPKTVGGISTDFQWTDLSENFSERFPCERVSSKNFGNISSYLCRFSIRFVGHISGNSMSEFRSFPVGMFSRIHTAGIYRKLHTPPRQNITANIHTKLANWTVGSSQNTQRPQVSTTTSVRHGRIHGIILYITKGTDGKKCSHSSFNVPSSISDTELISSCFPWKGNNRQMMLLQESRLDQWVNKKLEEVVSHH